MKAYVIVYAHDHKRLADLMVFSSQEEALEYKMIQIAEGRCIMPLKHYGVIELTVQRDGFLAVA